MTTAQQALFSLSRTVVQVLAARPEVKGILCFGSHAMGTHDADSDIDLFVFCAPELLPEPAREDCWHRLEGIQALSVGHVEAGWENQWCPQSDRFRLNGLPFDLTYNRLSWMQGVVRQVKETGATTLPELRFRPYTMLGLLENSMILYDPQAALAELTASLQPYPEALRQALLSENLAVLHASLEDMQDYVRRGIGNTAFHFHLNRAVDALAGALFALNRRYDPATKRTEQALGRLHLLPDHFSARYAALLETALIPSGRQKVVKELAALVNEVEACAGASFLTH